MAAAELVTQGVLAVGRVGSNPVERNIEDSGAAYLVGIIPVKGQPRARARAVERGTRLFVNGRSLGSIPLSANLAKPGPHAVRLEIPGWQPYTLKLGNPLRLAVGVGEVEAWPPVIVNCKTGEVFTARKLPSLDPYHAASAGDNPNITFRVGSAPMLLVTTADRRARGWDPLGQMRPAGATR